MHLNHGKACLLFLFSLFLYFNCFQENDIFLGWEKGAGKKWARSRRKGGADVSLEEMKKQAAVQCLRSASDEVSKYFKPHLLCDDQQ